MKQTVKLIALAGLTLLLSSCIDIFHTVSLHKGKADVTVRYTIQKAMLDMLSSFSGEEMDYSEFSELGDEIFGEFEGIRAEVEPIDTSYHFGARVRIGGPVRKLREELDDSYFLPVKQGDSYIIRIPSLKDEEEMDDSGLAFLGGAKYTLMVDLSGDLRDIRRARLAMDGRTPEMENYGDIGVNVYGKSMVVEMSMALLFLAPEEVVIELLEG